jgi:hypothetical protein
MDKIVVLAGLGVENRTHVIYNEASCGRGFGRKRALPSFWYYPGFCLKDLRRHTIS